MKYLTWISIVWSFVVWSGCSLILLAMDAAFSMTDKFNGSHTGAVVRFESVLFVSECLLIYILRSALRNQRWCGFGLLGWLVGTSALFDLPSLNIREFPTCLAWVGLGMLPVTILSVCLIGGDRSRGSRSVENSPSAADLESGDPGVIRFS